MDLVLKENFLEIKGSTVTIGEYVEYLGVIYQIVSEYDGLVIGDRVGLANV
jgi:hypothetical protein